MRKGCCLLLLSVVVFSFSHGGAALADEDWAVTLYGAQLSADSLGDTLACQADYEDAYLVALALSKRMLTFGKYVDVELEGQAVKHFGDQDHWEFNGLPVLRWLPFPWDRYLETSLAIGAGLSYAMETPPVEEIGVSDTPKLLGYLMFELAFSLDRFPAWSLVARLHHRSGANGLFSDRLDASNAVGLGVKITF